MSALPLRCPLSCGFTNMWPNTAQRGQEQSPAYLSNGESRHSRISEAATARDPFKKLAGAVILSALSDAQNGSQEAQVWLLEDRLSFRFWCGVYGVEPNWARSCMKKAIRTAPVTRRRRRELVIQTLREHPEWSNREISRRLGCNYAAVRRVRKLLPQALAR